MVCNICRIFFYIFLIFAVPVTLLTTTYNIPVSIAGTLIMTILGVWHLLRKRDRLEGTSEIRSCRG
jgi:hypothetical protein